MVSKFASSLGQGTGSKRSRSDPRVRIISPSIAFSFPYHLRKICVICGSFNLCHSAKAINIRRWRRWAQIKDQAPVLEPRAAEVQ